MALTRPFAQNGDKLAIPDTASDSSVSYNLGFTYAYALPPEEGGKFIDRAQFNQLMYDTTSQVLANKQAISDLDGATYSKTEVNNLLNAKANANATVNLTGAQNIQGVKTFSSIPISATQPTSANQIANKAYVDSVGNTKVALTGNQTIAGVKTFSAPPVSATNPTANNQVANKAYVDTISATKPGFITKTLAIGANEKIKDLNEFMLFTRNNFANYYILSITSDIEVNQTLNIYGLRFEINPTTYKIKVNAPIKIVNSSVSLSAINFEFGTGSTYMDILSTTFAINGNMNIIDNANADVSDFLFFINNSKVGFGVGDTFVINSPKRDIFALSGGTTLAFMTMTVSGNIGGNLVEFIRPALLFSSGTNFSNLTVTSIAQNTLTSKGIWFNI